MQGSTWIFFHLLTRKTLVYRLRAHFPFRNQFHKEGTVPLTHRSISKINSYVILHILNTAYLWSCAALNSKTKFIIFTTHCHILWAKIEKKQKKTSIIHKSIINVWNLGEDSDFSLTLFYSFRTFLILKYFVSFLGKISRFA